ncbi:MAG: hypothetical protein M1833_001445 [Piccolia ochrophora]|nr:MAG: hypothetical protein M1833_001445 [Piccolia ochrophora]
MPTNNPPPPPPRRAQSQSSLLNWLSRKRYQYEVTFSLYMLTPTEKFIFNSFLFLFVSMIIIAASLYFPQHVQDIARRLWWYYAGENYGAGTSAEGRPPGTDAGMRDGEGGGLSDKGGGREL